MKIDVKTVNILEGSWIDDDYHVTVYPRLVETSAPIARQIVLPLTRLYDDSYWAELRAAHKYHIAIPDYLHWQCEDSVYDKYVQAFSSVRFPVVSLFESPFGFEMPKNIPMDVFAKKVSERTAKLALAIKDRNPDTIILSPAINVYSEKIQSVYLDYFIQNRRYFDGYAVHCCNDMTEHTLGQLTTFLNQVMNVLPKKIWVTKWAIPCFDSKVMNSKVLGPTGWEPYQTNAAMTRLNRSMTLITSIARNGIHWFYVGIGKDSYNPRLSPSNDLFRENKNPILLNEPISIVGWNFSHFLGLMDTHGQLKSNFISKLSKFITTKNNE